ncbi:MAG: T9SS type A sorting domain-containing protein [Bacteroidetes bacterium]|nr:T9SS type A sorting domain-containing protein [Bacteroidota bacterium]
MGGLFSETGFSLAVDTLHNIYVTGNTNSPDFPLTANALQFVQDGFADVFVTKINPSGTGLIYSTLLGGGGSESGNSIKLDDSLAAYIVGTTSSNDFDITPGAYQTTFGGGFQDAFIFKLSSSGSVLSYSSYLGGSNTDFGNTILVESSDIVHFSGSTNSIDFPTTLGSYQPNNTNTNFDIFNSKMCLSGLKLSSSSNTTNQLICINAPMITVNYSVVGTASITNVVFTGLPAGVFGTWTPNNLIISGIPTVSGTFNYSINTTLDCGEAKVKTGIITVNPIIGVFTASLSPTLCVNTQIPTIKHKTDGVPWISNVLGLPAGVFANLSGDALYIDGTATSIGLYNYTITLAGCGPNVFATGTIIVNTCTAIEDYSANYFFSISPNPSEGIYQITFEKGISSVGLLEVYDMQGRLIMKESIATENTQQLNLKNQPNGMYVLKVKTGNLEEVIKLVKL